MENNEELLIDNENMEDVTLQDEVSEVEETEVEGGETETEEETEEYVENNVGYSEEILYELDLQSEALFNIETTLSEIKQTIWDKPIADYTATEGLLLIIMFVILAGFVFDIIGGILCLK